MSTTAVDLDSPGRAVHQGQVALDLAAYVLTPLRKDTEFVLLRGVRPAPLDGNGPSSILALIPVANSPSATTLRALQNDYALRSELDPQYAVRSLAIVRHEGRPMLILEDHRGTPLDLLLDGAMGTTQFLRLAIRIAAALGHLHSRGLVHKNIKPANVLVNPTRDEVWLMGLGIASRISRERQLAMPSQYLVGTLAYMSPEQTGRINRSIDSRSDLYSLGVTFYEMLTGSLPFTSTEPMELVHCHLARQPIPPCEKLASIPRAISSIVSKLLGKAAEERYQTAKGVERDLQHCLSEWELQGRIEEFTQARQDAPDQLQISEQLYGRESEIRTLLGAFDRMADRDNPELVLISGYAGVGKSSLVNEIRKTLVSPQSLFASGKFDQYNRDIPYATLAQAFKGLIQSLLGKSEVELASWREALLEAVGSHGRLMIELVPELELIIGQQPAVSDLSAQEARGRFQAIFRRFLSVFARPEHPLALFLDDLQWLDMATADLLEDLTTGADLRHLLLIGAYRANEVAPLHSLRLKMDAIGASGGHLVEITLDPLLPEHLQQLVSHTLGCDMERAAPLSLLVHQKTGGNPYFANRFMTSLADEGLLAFDHRTGIWSWNLDQIHAKGYTDNLIDLLLGGLNRLPPETLDALQQLACLGNIAAMTTLVLICDMTEAEIHAVLHPAVLAGLLEHRDGCYSFAHDRVHEAAYLLMPEKVRAELHLELGRELAQRMAPEGNEEAIYEIVNQFNRGLPLITSESERKRVAQLNLVAARRAKAAAAHSSALKYLNAGASLLTEECWETEYPLAFAIEIGRAESELVTGYLTDAEVRLEMLFSRSLNLVDKAATVCLGAMLYTMLNRLDRAAAICVEYLRNARVDWPEHPTEHHVRKEYDRLLAQLRTRPIDSLLELPLMIDPTWRATMNVLAELAAPAYMIDTHMYGLVMLRISTLSIEHGNCDASCYAYGYLIKVIGPRFGDYRLGSRFGQISLDLAENKGLGRYKARVYQARGVGGIPWEQHIRAAIPFIRQSLDHALETGDQTYAAYAYAIFVWNRMATADPLEEVQREADLALDFAQKVRFGMVSDFLAGSLGLIRTLRGLTPEFGAFSDGAFNETVFERRLAEGSLFTGNSFIASRYWIGKLQARFYSGNYQQAVAAAAEARPHLHTTSGLYQETEFHFFSALARAAAADSAGPDERCEHLEALTGHHQRLAGWAENSPETFDNQAALVAAEIARLNGKELEAQHFYEQATRSAGKHGFMQNEGLAYELSSKFYAARGLHAVADPLLQKARRCYERWGAEGKVRQLLTQHPTLTDDDSSIGSRGTERNATEQLSLATVMKVSQALSGEMDMNRLLDKLMRAAVENAGAERGLLVAQQDDKLCLLAQASAHDDGIDVELQESEHVADSLPQSLVRYVLRTRDTVLLEDASTQNPFSLDPYLLKHRTRSLLCLPLVNQDHLIGALYLENNFAPQVFAPDRITVLKLLASQAAMALENSRLYRDLAKRESKIRRLLDASVVGISMWEHDVIVDANDAYLRIVGYDREDLISGRLQWQNVIASYSNGQDLEEINALFYLNGMVQPFEWEYVRKDGRRVPVLIGAARFERRDEGVAFALDLTELRGAEKALRKSEAYLAEAQRITHTGSWARDVLAGRISYYSDETFRLYGLDPRRDALPQREEILALIHPEDRQLVIEELQRVFREKAEYSQDYRIVLPDGNLRHLHSIGHPILDPSGALVEYAGTLVDITTQKRAEQRLLMQYRVTRVLADAVSMTQAAPKILEAMGECLGWNWGSVWCIDSTAAVLRRIVTWRGSAAEATPLEVSIASLTFTLGSGLPGQVWQTAAPMCVSSTMHDEAFPGAEHLAPVERRNAIAIPILLGLEVHGVIGFFSSDAIQPEEELLVVLSGIGSQIGEYIQRTAAVDELQLRVSMLQNIPVAAWSVMPDGTPDIVNRLWYEYTGQTPEYVHSHHEAWMSTLHPDDRESAARSYWGGIRSGLGFTMEARLLRARDNTYRWHLNQAMPVHDAEGKLLRFVGTSTDVHEWRQAQDALRNTLAEFSHMTRVMTMGELAASIAHEVNQPLGAMVTSAAAGARWLSGDTPRIDKARGALERIASDGRRAGEVIRRIRAMMKRQEPRKQWLDVNGLILEVLSLAQHQLRRGTILVERQLDHHIVKICGDKVQIQQVLLNLIINAIEAMSEIKDRARTLTVVSAPFGSEAISVEIRDTGIGLDAQQLEHLFEPFFTTKTEGLGVGLSISRSIVEAHGGRLEARTNTRFGAVFSVLLPVNEPKG